MALGIIRIEPTKITPEVLFLEGHLEIRGRSISENSTDFYRPLEEWVAIYVEQTEIRTRVIFSFEFIFTSTIL